MSESEMKWLLCGLLFIAKLGDNVSTWLISPTLKLEANPIARKGRWVFIWLTMLICFVPYLSLPAAVTILPPLLFIAANNFSGLWTARALGEEGTLKFYTDTAGRGSFGLAVLGEFLRSVFLIIAGVVLAWLSGDNGWTVWFAYGLIITGPILMVHHVFFYRRIFRQAREAGVHAGH